MGLKTTIQKIKWINEPYTAWKWRQKKISLGTDYPDQTFYVVRRATSKVGLFSHVMVNLGQIKWAVEQGYTPVIDMQNNPCSFLDSSEVGKVNAWEFFFEQPCNYSLDDISHAAHVILGNGIVGRQHEYPGVSLGWDLEECRKWREICHYFVRPKKELFTERDRLFEELFGQKRVLGVLCRGTDYLLGRPSGHPIQPEPIQAVEKAKEMADRLECEYLYLATEDEGIYQVFLKEFGDRLITTQKKRTTITAGENVNDKLYGGQQDKRAGGLEYLMNILILAKCNALLAGNVGGTQGALVLSDGYEEAYVFDLGFYE